MRCNTPLMNSWHSFSPNGRWLVFSSKSRSPYTQMFLTHIDEDGRDSPPILIENSTAANRAVNIPEFVNIPPDGMEAIQAPAVEYYRQFDLAFDLARKGQHEAAVAAWRRVLELGTEDSKAYMNLGVSLAATGRLDEAMESYRKAQGMDPADAEILMNYGVALAGAGRFEEAIGEYRKALEINTEYAEAHNNLGLALARRAKLAEAILHYRKALEVNPGLSAVYNNLGAALAQSGQPGEAVEQFKKYVESSPDSVEGNTNLVRALLQAGRAPEAVSHLEGILRQHPNSASVHNSLGVALVWAQRREEAIVHFQRALEIDPSLMEARQNLGDALSASPGRTAEAVAQWREVLRAAPNNVAVLNETALVLASDPDPAVRDGREAVDLAERAARLTGSREPVVLDTLAAAYAEVGRFQEAVETARRALALAESQGRQPLAGEIRARLALYEAGTPFRRRRAG
jgi:tetratricopeptide (TPR) repeat protein